MTPRWLAVLVTASFALDGLTTRLALAAGLGHELNPLAPDQPSAYLLFCGLRLGVALLLVSLAARGAIPRRITYAGLYVLVVLKLCAAVSNGALLLAGRATFTAQEVWVAALVLGWCVAARCAWAAPDQRSLASAASIQSNSRAGSTSMT
jgi:hypothetical protein